MLRDVCANCQLCVVLPPTKKVVLNLAIGIRVPVLISASLGMTPEIISLCSVGDLFWSLPSFATFVRRRLRHAVFSVRYELVAYVLYG